jgi:hypothetical protein
LHWVERCNADQARHDDINRMDGGGYLIAPMRLGFERGIH